MKIRDLPAKGEVSYLLIVLRTMVRKKKSGITMKAHMKWNSILTSNNQHISVGCKWENIVTFIMVPIYSLSPHSIPGSMPRLSFG
jgi:hypothetical protein